MRLPGGEAAPARYPARQTLEASRAIARLHRLDAASVLFAQQHPAGIDAGAFHTDVLAVGNGSFFMLHELAFVDAENVLARLAAIVGPGLSIELARQSELPVTDAVTAYPFNSQVLTLADGSMAILAPIESEETPTARAFLERVLAGPNPVRSVVYLDLRQSMNNGGGPACLRQRVPLTDAEVARITADVFFTEELDAALTSWVERRYRDRLLPGDLADPALARESMEALDELTEILAIGSVYDFQR